eukprot:CAMPEP_0180000928 /NCGR_PEP_ID=MMETSP0984-20121128/10111_1 /TAXON_ID=483367 /ORGANISM="non described non described, Strain CCMP 2436" /LENGTH=59 /DNA_ID=CAMNT_0021920981 /DNA_START=902 /DNA_END=1078 /DNA_ORIENTATION=-
MPISVPVDLATPLARAQRERLRTRWQAAREIARGVVEFEKLGWVLAEWRRNSRSADERA